MKKLLLAHGFIGTMVVIVAFGGMLDRDWRSVAEGLIRRDAPESRPSSESHLHGVGNQETFRTPVPLEESDNAESWLGWLVDFAFFCLTLSGLTMAWETACQWRNRWWNWWHRPLAEQES